MNTKTKSNNGLYSLEIKELSEREQFVLELIQEYLDKNRYFNEITIKPFIQSRVSKSSINISNEGIKVILKSLVEKTLIVNGSKLLREDVLANSNRKKIYKYIVENPGTYFNQIVKKFKFSKSVVEWHISMLTKFGFIKREKINSHEVYFSEGISQEYGKIIHLISREKCSQIIEFLEMKNNGYTKTQLSNQLNMHHKTIRKYINRLVNYNIIYSEKRSNNTLYFLNLHFYNELKQGK